MILEQKETKVTKQNDHEAGAWPRYRFQGHAARKKKVKTPTCVKELTVKEIPSLPLFPSVRFQGCRLPLLGGGRDGGHAGESALHCDQLDDWDPTVSPCPAAEPGNDQPP
jgi:hypothetical protein